MVHRVQVLEAALEAPHPVEVEEGVVLDPPVVVEEEVVIMVVQVVLDWVVPVPVVVMVMVTVTTTEETSTTITKAVFWIWTWILKKYPNLETVLPNGFRSILISMLEKFWMAFLVSKMNSLMIAVIQAVQAQDLVQLQPKASKSPQIQAE